MKLVDEIRCAKRWEDRLFYILICLYLFQASSVYIDLKSFKKDVFEVEYDSAFGPTFLPCCFRAL